MAVAGHGRPVWALGGAHEILGYAESALQKSRFFANRRRERPNSPRKRPRDGSGEYLSAAPALNTSKGEIKQRLSCSQLLQRFSMQISMVAAGRPDGPPPRPRLMHGTKRVWPRRHHDHRYIQSVLLHVHVRMLMVKTRRKLSYYSGIPPLRQFIF